MLTIYLVCTDIIIDLCDTLIFVFYYALCQIELKNKKKTIDLFDLEFTLSKNLESLSMRCTLVHLKKLMQMSQLESGIWNNISICQNQNQNVNYADSEQIEL